MFSLFRISLGHMLSSTSRLSRQIRRHMKEIVQLLDANVIEDVWKELEEAARYGDVDVIDVKFRRAEKVLFEMGMGELLELEKNLEAMESRFESRLWKSYMLEYLKRIKNLLPQDAKEQRELLDQTIAIVERMYSQMLDEIKKSYAAVFEQSREVQEHEFLTRATGLAVLTRAMRNTYLLRGEYSQEKIDIGKLEDVEKHYYAALEQVQKSLKEMIVANRGVLAAELPKSGRLSEKFGKAPEELKEYCETLAKHVEVVFQEFSFVMRVFVQYYFMLHHYRKLLDDYLKMLADQGYPRKETEGITGLDAMRKRQYEYEEKLKGDEKEIADAEARMGRITQKILGEVAALK